VKLNDTNYLAWSKAIKVVSRVKKLKFLLEDPPPEMAADYEDWMSADTCIMSWLWHSVETHIASNVQWYEITKQIWTSLEESYSQKWNVAHVSELYELLFTTKKNEKSVNE